MITFTTLFIVWNVVGFINFLERSSFEEDLLKIKTPWKKKLYIALMVIFYGPLTFFSLLFVITVLKINKIKDKCLQWFYK